MLFNSIDFVFFLPLVLLLYWLIGFKNIKRQNFLLAISSYVFYGWWSPKFLILILFSSILDFTIGSSIFYSKSIKKKKFLLYLSLIINLGLLCVFKYFNFFIENFNAVFTLVGTSFRIESLQIILPVGISFYTFQTLSYTIDIYKGKLKPSKDFISFIAFVSFFPQLVAGPIERASNLLPQFYTKRSIRYNDISEGLRQILWGFFKKVVIADNCATYVNLIYGDFYEYSGSTLFVASILFAFQIYGDFSGYSDIAIGVSRLFGFKLMVNFSYPYFSKNVTEFWRKWHISLTTWFRDYIYIPLGGSNGGDFNRIRNIFIVFLISGFWHGANWTFIFWGFLNALYFVPLLLLKKSKYYCRLNFEKGIIINFILFIKITTTFILTVITWIFFRSNNLSEAFKFVYHMISYKLISIPDYFLIKRIGVLFCLIAFMNVIEWLGKKGDFALSYLEVKISIYWRWCIYSLIIFLIGMYMKTEETPFIYFQF